MGCGGSQDMQQNITKKVYGVADMERVIVRGVTFEIRRTKNKTWELNPSTRHEKNILIG